jgi:hypothetical protein
MLNDQSKIRSGYLLFVVVAVLAVLCFGKVSAQNATTSQNSVELFQPSDKPFGSSYEDHVKNFWKLYLKIPINDNPLEDRTGAMCNYGKNGQNETKTIFYLTGNSGGNTVKTCKIPAGLGLFIPVLAGEFSQGESKGSTVEDLRITAKNDQESMQNLVLSINGKAIPEEVLRSYAILTGDFDTIFPNNAVYGADPGPSKAVADGYYVITKPLPPGNYDIIFSGRIPSDPGSTEPPFSTQSTYHLIVE